MLGLAGCFEPPVVEFLTLEFSPDGAVAATLEVRLAAPGKRESRAVERRIDDRQRDLLAGVDPWLDRFAALESAEDGAEWRRQAGRLRSYRRWARLDEAAGLVELFQNDAAQFAFQHSGELAILELIPTGTSRATRKERLRVEREIDAWASSYADYLAAALALDAYLGERPEQAEACWRVALDEPEGETDLAPEAGQLAAALADRMMEVMAALEIDPAEGYSLDERVRQVFHPLVARLGVELPVEPEEIGGFVRADERAYVVPELALWDAAERLEGRWLTLDPLRALAAALRREDAAPIDVAPFARASIAAVAAPPAAAEVSAALRAELEPPSLYRLSWRSAAAADSWERE